MNITKLTLNNETFKCEIVIYSNKANTSTVLLKKYMNYNYIYTDNSGVARIY